MIRWPLLVATVVWSLLAPCLTAAAQKQTLHLPRDYALLITGIAGDDDHYRKFWKLTIEMYRVLRTRYGYSDEEIVCLFQDKSDEAKIVDAVSRRAQIEAAFRDLATRLRREDRLLIFVVAHADYDGRRTRLHLPGPDISAKEFARLVNLLPCERIITVVTTPVSGYFLPLLSKKGRITITATLRAKEISETVFPYSFVRALENPKTDTDGNGRLSVLELFRFARDDVMNFYRKRKLLPTEHAMLDDNGDAIGSQTIDEESQDGQLAGRTYFEPVVGG
ncbi:MAG TPA: hypothetical protein EYP14_14990 [Planctomycetaceae bacterium]|nr:hypothetical protein [Planctomycetaceae bacterium]